MRQHSPVPPMLMLGTACSVFGVWGCVFRLSGFHVLQCSLGFSFGGSIRVCRCFRCWFVQDAAMPRHEVETCQVQDLGRCPDGLQ